LKKISNEVERKNAGENNDADDGDQSSSLSGMSELH